MAKKKKIIKKCKKKIPRALREQVWLQNIGKHFEYKCLIKWCQNRINTFDFNVGHDIPESKGGGTNINNLKPICNRCNLSMGNQYSIQEWSKMGESTEPVVPVEPVEPVVPLIPVTPVIPVTPLTPIKPIKKRSILSWLRMYKV